MDVTPLIKSGTQVVQGYSGGGFKVSGASYEGPIIVTPESTKPWDFSKNINELRVEDFRDAGDMDVVLLGTGARMALLPPDVRKALKEEGLSVDVMDTGAACRTYNVLVAEGRRVAAALLPL